MGFNLLNQIGEAGGFGRVFKCIDDENGYLFACKFLERDTDMAVKRFEREVRLLNRLDHPNIIKAITYNFSEENRYYIMPLYKCSLSKVIPEIEGNTYAQYRIINAVLNGIAYLHSEGVIHRDLKPDNILYNNDNDIVITDFGLGIQQDSESATLTQSASYGTFRYCSPEQWEDMHLVDERTDIYAIGKIIEDIVTNFNTIEIPDSTIKYVIDKCTRNNKEDRFATVDELKAIIDSYYSIMFGEPRNIPIEKELLKLATNQVTRYEMIDIANEVISENDAEIVEIFFKNIFTENYKFLEQYSLILTKDLVQKLCEYWNQSGWPFSYIDTIADLVKKIYIISEDAEIKSLLLYELMDLAISYNRWYAMDVVKELFEDVLGNIPVQSELTMRLRERRLAIFNIFDSEEELPRMIRDIYQ